MRILSVSILAMLVGCGTVGAQTPTGPAMATSPLGMLGSAAPGGFTSTGSPLGATEIDGGGLSPLPGLNCNASGSSSSGMSGTAGMTGISGVSGMPSASGTISPFDGGGVASAGGMTGMSSCTLPSPAVSSAGMASPLSTPGQISTFRLNGGTIPLGATELGNAGVSPLITSPMPSSMATPCTGSMTTATSPGSTSTGVSTLGTAPGC